MVGHVLGSGNGKVMESLEGERVFVKDSVRKKTRSD